VIEYLYLDDDEIVAVARARVLELERDHYRLRLMLGECIDPGEAMSLQSRIAEIERRHAAHTTPAPQPEPATGPGPEPTAAELDAAMADLGKPEPEHVPEPVVTGTGAPGSPRVVDRRRSGARNGHAAAAPSDG
jgi:hypothetical protein